tara:strand:+ start:6934 stop:7143 length:210 start_codon:yes stop_codon:yes gene_type:complete
MSFAKSVMVEGEVCLSGVVFGESMVVFNCPLIEQEQRNKAISKFWTKKRIRLNLKIAGKKVVVMGNRIR